MPMIKVFTRNPCAFCSQTKLYLDRKGADYQVIDVTDAYNPEYETLSALYGISVPLVHDGEDGYCGWQLEKLNGMIARQK